MIVNEKIAIDHGLKKEEYQKICELLKRTPNILNLEFFQRCGMNIVPTNLQDFI